MEAQSRDLEFSYLQAISKRIIAAKHNLFVGIPYKSPMKKCKQRTFKRLNEMQNKNIKEVSSLFVSVN